MHNQERHTAKPEDEETDHGRCIDALALGNTVLEGEERGPDGTDHDAHGIRAVHVLNGEPEDGEDGARYDGDVGAPETPGGARDDGEGDVVEDADCAV